MKKLQKAQVDNSMPRINKKLISDKNLKKIRKKYKVLLNKIENDEKAQQLLIDKIRYRKLLSDYGFDNILGDIEKNFNSNEEFVNELLNVINQVAKQIDKEETKGLIEINAENEQDFNVNFIYLKEEYYNKIENDNKVIINICDDTAKEIKMLVYRIAEAYVNHADAGIITSLLKEANKYNDINNKKYWKSFKVYNNAFELDVPIFWCYDLTGNVHTFQDNRLWIPDTFQISILDLNNDTDKNWALNLIKDLPILKLGDADYFVNNTICVSDSNSLSWSRLYPDKLVIFTMLIRYNYDYEDIDFRSFEEKIQFVYHILGTFKINENIQDQLIFYTEFGNYMIN